MSGVREKSKRKKNWEKNSSRFELQPFHNECNHVGYNDIACSFAYWSISCDEFDIDLFLPFA